MSIYATLWTLKFPSAGDDFYGCDWISVTAQAVPPHIGAPGPVYGYEDGDPYAEFLPPPVDPDGDIVRAVVFVTDLTPKGTGKHGQEYIEPLLVMTGEEYRAMSFEDLHERICSALRGSQPKVTMQIFDSGTSYVIREDGSKRSTGPLPPHSDEDL